MDPSVDGGEDSGGARWYGGRTAIHYSEGEPEMTLNTQVFVMTEVDPHEVFWKCRELLGTPESLPFEDEPSEYNAGNWDLLNPCGVGLPAWLWMHYRPGEMIRPNSAAHEEFCSEGCDGSNHDPAYWFDVTFDTAYSYRDAEGRGCGSLHASLVAQLGMWLDERNVRWAWQNEYTGEIHIGDRYEHLFDLIATGNESRRWFLEIVKPVIEHAFGGPLQT